MADTSTPFSDVYDMFLSKITDDLFLELTEVDTYRMMSDLLESAIPWFEFPRVTLDYELEYTEDEGTYCGVDSNQEEVTAYYCAGGNFSNALTKEEINILATYMIVEWLGQQLASIENTRMKYTGSDFKMTSQANHMSKLMSTKKEYERVGFHLQRLYKRKRVGETSGMIESTFDTIMEKSTSDYQ